jgi:hypothetical protein
MIVGVLLWRILLLTSTIESVATGQRLTGPQNHISGGAVNPLSERREPTRSASRQTLQEDDRAASGVASSSASGRSFRALSDSFPPCVEVSDQERRRLEGD